MRRELAIEFSRVTESAALAGYKWLGRGDKNTADGAAVNAMRIMLNQVNIDGTIVIGEGEIDEAPMLYIGEKVGTGRGDAVDIAVDPIEGTRMTAMGQANALAVLAVGDKGCFLNAPDMYMEKLIVGPGAKGTIDLNLPLADNLRNVAAASSFSLVIKDSASSRVAKKRENLLVQLSLSITVPISIAHPLVLHLSTTSFIGHLCIFASLSITT